MNDAVVDSGLDGREVVDPRDVSSVVEDGPWQMRVPTAVLSEAPNAMEVSQHSLVPTIHHRGIGTWFTLRIHSMPLRVQAVFTGLAPQAQTPLSNMPYNGQPPLDPTQREVRFTRVCEYANCDQKCASIEGGVRPYLAMMDSTLELSQMPVHRACPFDIRIWVPHDPSFEEHLEDEQGSRPDLVGRDETRIPCIGMDFILVSNGLRGEFARSTVCTRETPTPPSPTPPPSHPLPPVYPGGAYEYNLTITGYTYSGTIDEFDENKEILAVNVKNFLEEENMGPTRVSVYWKNVPATTRRRHLVEPSVAQLSASSNIPSVVLEIFYPDEIKAETCKNFFMNSPDVLPQNIQTLARTNSLMLTVSRSVTPSPPSPSPPPSSSPPSPKTASSSSPTLLILVGVLGAVIVIGIACILVRLRSRKESRAQTDPTFAVHTVPNHRAGGGGPPRAPPRAPPQAPPTRSPSGAKKYTPAATPRAT